MRRWDDGRRLRRVPCPGRSRGSAGHAGGLWASFGWRDASNAWRCVVAGAWASEWWCFFYFSWRKISSGPPNRGAKKSPPGLTPEGLKSCERSEPSGRDCDGYDGNDNGGKAMGDCEGRFTGVVHCWGITRSMRVELSSAFLADLIRCGFGYGWTSRVTTTLLGATSVCGSSTIKFTAVLVTDPLALETTTS